MGKPGAGSQDQNTEKTGGDQTGAGATDENKTKDQTAGQGDQGQNSEDDSVYADPEKAKAYARKLRDEAAKARNKAKDLESRFNALEATQKKLKAALGGEEEEEVDPEEAIGRLTAHGQALEVELGISQLALQHGIPMDQLDYFRFKMAQAFDGLEEEGELSEDELAAIIADVRKIGGGSKGGSTGLNTQKRPDDSGGANSVTLEQFAEMSVPEKSALYEKDKGTYQKLFQEAVKRRLL
jgi:hypothetical protein